MTSPRVLLIGINYDPEVTGIAPYSSGLLAGLAARGVDVAAITTYPHYPEWQFRTDAVKWKSDDVVDGVAVRRVRHYLPAPNSLIRRSLSEVTFGLRAVATRWKSPDVVILVSPAMLSSWLCQIRLRLSRRSTRSIVWVQDLYGAGVAETGHGSTASRLVGGIESRLLRDGDHVVVIHESFEQAVRQLPGMSQGPVSIVRNWSHVDLPVESVERERTRAGWGWRPDETVVLHAGNMGVKQGLEHVVDAARVVDRTGAPIRFVLLGDGSRRAALAEAAADVKSLTFLDPLPSPDFENTLAAADVLLVNEAPGVANMSVPSKLTTYFATALPVVAAVGSDGATAREMELSGAGVVVAPDDPAGLVGVVQDLADNRPQAAALGKAGFAYRQRVLSVDMALDGWSAVIQALTPVA